MSSGRKIFAALLALAFPVLMNAAGQDFEARRLQIQYAEKLSVAPRAGQVEFDAYGRRFALELESNDRLHRAWPGAAKAGISAGQLWRGTIEGNASSWVRLARVGGGLEGAIWDGGEMYVVTRYGDIARHLTTPLALPDGQTVIYKLSDTLNGLPDGFCGLGPDTPQLRKSGESALSQYKTLVHELQAAAAIAPADQVNVSLIGDTELQQQNGAAATEIMLARLNTTDGIFSQQVGVTLAATDVRLMPASNDPFTTTDPSGLLHQVADYRAATPAVAATGVAHLVTGKNLDGNPIGIGFLDGLCDPHFGASLSDTEYGGFYGALIMAHEFGHNFGADHDGETGSVCAGTPRTYLMSPNLNGSGTFSQCSLTSIAATVGRARGICVGPSQYAEVGLQGPPAISLDAGLPFDVALTVRSLGTLAVSDVNLTMQLPGGMSFLGATLTGGSCGATAGVVSCVLGDMPAGETRNVTLRLQSPLGNHYELNPRVSASNDRLAANNTTTVFADLRSATDLAVAISASATRFFVNDLVDVMVDLSVLRTQPAHGAVVHVGIGPMAMLSFDAGPHTCTYTPMYATLDCQLADIAPGTTSRITIHTRSSQPYIGTMAASIQLTGDGDSSNNYASLNFEALAERDIDMVVDQVNLRAVLGAPYELRYTITTRGRLPVDNVAFYFFSAQGSYGGVESLDVSLGTCTGFYCNLGTLTPGQVVTFTAHVRYVQPADIPLTASVNWSESGNPRQRTAGTSILAALRIDAAAQIGSPATVSEGQAGAGWVYVSSRGVDPAQNVVATLDLPAPARLTALNMDSAARGWQCTLLTSQRGECRGNFTTATSLPIYYEFKSDTPVSGNVTVGITGDQDGDGTNNQASTTLTVQPYLDVGIKTTETSTILLFPGRVQTANYIVTTGARPVPGVVLNISPASPFNELVSVNGGAVNCQMANGQPQCALGDLPANANVPVAIQFRNLITGASAQISVGVGTPRDDNYSNQIAFLSWVSVDFTDAQLSVATTSVSGTAGAPFSMPLITVNSGIHSVLGVVVQIPLPSFAKIATVSTPGICTGTTTLECRFDYVDPSSPRTIDVSLTATAAGTFTSNITMSAVNDSSAANNSSSVALTVTAASGGGGGGGGGAGGGGGGGGGRIEWALLFLLGVLLISRQTRSSRGPN